MPIVRLEFDVAFVAFKFPHRHQGVPKLIELPETRNDATSVMFDGRDAVTIAKLYKLT